MTKRSNCAIISGLISGLLAGLLFLALGIVEAVFLSKYDSEDIIGGCWQVWPNIVACCVLNFITFFLIVIGTLIDLVSEDGSKSGQASGSILGLLIRIWTLVIFFNMSDSCKDMYDEKAPILLVFLHIEAIVFIVLSALGVLLCVCFCCCATCVLCCSAANSSKGTAVRKPVPVGRGIRTGFDDDFFKSGFTAGTGNLRVDHKTGRIVRA